MKKLKVRIVDQDCFPGLEKQAEFFIDILKKKYDVKLLKNNYEIPDLLFFSCYGGENLKWTNCKRIYHTAERDIPNYNLCDYAIGLTDIGYNDRFLHFPSYVYYNNILKKCEGAIKENNNKDELLNRGFCSAVVSDPYRDRIFYNFFSLLSNYKKIESGGRIKNTIGFRVPDKIKFISKYKFNIAFENMYAPGYVTEKIIEAFTAKTIPIYWGSNTVKKEFGEDGYININDFSSLHEAIDYIKTVDNDNALYMKILNSGPTLLHSYEEWCEILLEYLSNIIENGTTIFNPNRNPSFNEKLLYYRIKNNRFSKFISFLMKKYNNYKLYGRGDVGEIYKTF